MLEGVHQHRPNMEFIEHVLAERRSLKKALKDLREKYKAAPSGSLAEMIQQLELELSYRESRERKHKVARHRK